MKEFPPAPPEMVKLARSFTGQNQDDAAKVIGVTRATWSKYEQGTHNKTHVSMPIGYYKLYLMEAGLLDNKMLSAPCAVLKSISKPLPHQREN